MITNQEIDKLLASTDGGLFAVKLPGGTALLYSQWFVLELPVALFGKDIKIWAKEPHAEVLTWREKMPKEEGDFAQGMRFTAPKDLVKLVKLVADSGLTYVSPLFYDVVMRAVPAAEFRTYAEKTSPVVIMSAGSRVGCVAPITL